MAIQDIFQKRNEKNYDITPYVGIFMVSIMFSGTFWILSSTPYSNFWIEYGPFFIISLCGVIFSVCKIFILVRKNPKLNELADEFFLLETIKNPNFLTLKKREILLEKMIAIFGPIRFDEKTKKQYSIQFIPIGERNIDWRKEEFQIKAAITEFLETHPNDFNTHLQQKFLEVFERIIEEKKKFIKDEKWEEIKQITHFSWFIKSIFQGIFWSIWLIFLLGFIFQESPGVNNFSELTLVFMVISVMMILIFWLIKILKTNNNNVVLNEDFRLLLDTSIPYLQVLQRKSTIHPMDALIFADIVKFFTENISERTKNLQKYEKFIFSHYCYFYIKIFVPKEIINFFREEKIKLKNDAQVVQKIIQKWSEMEKLRLEKERENSQNPLILASNKRREIMMRNLENINKNL